MANSTKTLQRTAPKSVRYKHIERNRKDSSQTKEQVLSLLRAAQFDAGIKTDSVKLIREERA